MKHYLFEETISGEQFIVEENNFGDAALAAEGIAEAIGKDWNSGEWELKFLFGMTEEEAEASGLDEY